MKSIFLIAAFTLSGLVQASEVTVMKCSVDARPVDGALEELVITKKDDVFSYRLVSEGISRMSGHFIKETVVEMSSCEFSSAHPGVGECNEYFEYGDMPTRRLTTTLAYGYGRDQLRATVFTMDSSNKEVLTQELSFDLEDCKLN